MLWNAIGWYFMALACWADEGFNWKVVVCICFGIWAITGARSFTEK